MLFGLALFDPFGGFPLGASASVVISGISGLQQPAEAPIN
jgi:hypothetical protein